MTPPSIGRMRHRFQLQAPRRTSDGGGGAVVTWAVMAEVWGSLEPAGGGERLEADALRGRETFEIWLRHVAGAGPHMRLVLGSRIFAIRSIADADGTRRFLRCIAEEVTA